MKKVSIISKTPENWRSLEATAACDDLFERLKTVLNDLAKEQADLCLITSMNLGPETLAAEAAFKLRDKINIKLECALPYEEQVKDWSESERDSYYGIIENCDVESLISTVYTDKCEQKCYEYMINTADIILLGTAPTKEVAELIKASGKQVLNI